MIISNLEKRTQQDIFLKLNDSTGFYIDLATIVKFDLFKGKELSAEDINNIKEYISINRIKLKCITLISKRPRSIKEIKDYLKKINKKNDIEDESIRNNKILEILIKERYLNDIEFAKWWVDNRNLFKIKSKREIKYELLRKGIEEDIINNILEQEKGSNETNKIRTLCLKKFGIEKINDIDLKAKNKIVNYLIRKGYSYEDIKNALIIDS